MKREEFDLRRDVSLNELYREMCEPREPMTNKDRLLLLGAFIGSWGLAISLGWSVYRLVRWWLS